MFPATLRVRVSVPGKESHAWLLVTSIAAVLVALSLLVAGCGGSSTPTPTHVVALFVDGLDHGDYRQSCQQWATGRKDPANCVGYIGYLAGLSGGFRWTVIPQSATVTENNATVKIDAAGQTLTAHLQKVGGRWIIETIS